MTNWFETLLLDDCGGSSHTWAIDDRGNNMIYLLTGTEKALLLDTGWGIGDLPALVASLTPLPLTVVNTHGHPDHVGGDGQFPQVYITDADRSLAMNCMSAQARRWAVDNQALPQPFPPDFDLDAWLASTTNFASIAEGHWIDLGERRLEVIALPGHSPGSICLLDRGSRWIFTGDSLLPWAIWLHLDESLPLGELLANLRRLQGYASAFDTETTGFRTETTGFRTIWPAHGELKSLGQPASLLDDMIAGIERILAGKLTGQPEHTFAGDGLRCDFGTCGVLYRPDRL
jgi:glyoxylase-like metal-dependent hydrolase (beta-lactamase superfamily II)